jgi:hypothetical protein
MQKSIKALWSSNGVWLIAGTVIGLTALVAVHVSAVSAAPLPRGIVYSGVVTPQCARAFGQLGSTDWTPEADASGTCHIRFPTVVIGAAVFVFGMDGAITPQSVHIGEEQISFLTINPGLGGGYSFMVVK